MQKVNKQSKSRSNSSILKAYLLFYNTIEALGWSFLLFNLIKYHINEQEIRPIFEQMKWLVLILPNSALLDIIHAATNMVPGNPVLVAQAVYFRVMLVWGAIIPTLAAKETIGLSITLLAWCIADAVRYSFYALNLINSVPYALYWLRFSSFIVVIPAGLCGELMLFNAAQKEFGKTGLWSLELTTNLCLKFQYFLIFNILLILAGSSKMYFHMLGQRKKALGRSLIEKKQS